MGKEILKANNFKGKNDPAGQFPAPLNRIYPFSLDSESWLVTNSVALVRHNDSSPHLSQFFELCFARENVRELHAEFDLTK